MHRTVVLLLVVVLGAVSLAACEVRPQLELTITVGTDAVDADPGDGVCESTAGAGDCTLRAAVGEANALTAATIGPKPAITARLTTDVTLGISGGLEDANQTGDLDVDLGGGGWLTIDGGGHVLDGADLDRQVDLVSGRLDIVGLTLTGGLASESGGAIVTRSGTSLVVDGSTFTGNRSVSKSNCIYTSPNPPSSCSVWMGGGGGAIRSFGAVVITGSTFDGNVAAPIANGCTSAFPPSTVCGATWGGAVLAAGPLAVVNSTFDGNVSGSAAEGAAGGGAIQATGGSVVVFSTFADNGTDRTRQVVGASVRTSILVDSTCAAPVLTADENLVSPVPCGTGGVPALGPLADNGGPTATRLPVVGSLATDAVMPDGDGTCAGAGADQRGATRPAGAACDIGAVERQPADG